MFHMPAKPANFIARVYLPTDNIYSSSIPQFDPPASVCGGGTEVRLAHHQLVVPTTEMRVPATSGAIKVPFKQQPDS